jgi:aspartokinase
LSSRCRPARISNWRIKSSTYLKRAQLRPLAVGVHADRQLLQFCYTSEVADSALKILDEAGLPGELRLRQGLALVAMVGAGVTRNPLHCHRFWQQLPVEFTWQSEEGISLVAVLRKGPTESLIQGLHHLPVPRGKTYWPGAVWQRQHRFPLAGAVRP